MIIKRKATPYIPPNSYLDIVVLVANNTAIFTMRRMTTGHFFLSEHERFFQMNTVNMMEHIPIATRSKAKFGIKNLSMHSYKLSY